MIHISKTLDIEPEPVVLFKLLMLFGPLPDALVKHVNDKEAAELFEGLWQSIVEEGLSKPFEQWSKETIPHLDSDARRLRLRMTNLDPTKRASMSDIMMDPYWN